MIHYSFNYLKKTGCYEMAAFQHHVNYVIFKQFELFINGS